MTASGSTTATEVARDFAVQVLGLPDPTVTEPPSVSIAGIGTVTIRLPGVDDELAVQVQRQVDGVWVITQVGEQRNLEGITMMPDGKPGPVMAIHPPLGATSADLTETTPEGIHKLHLTAGDLQTGVAHLIARKDLSVLLGPPIYTVLVVYRDSAGAVIDALGGTYG